ncbi:hypothetical protein AMJ39_05765 [candidate division TA06 bacterium DG_24]|jgi:putative Ca2+/H+ antiporter (TMEM165/GDT1 family)|uniref:GDT1 family protein n=2 Tax=Bacteria division TA06 TaxID=1156500 RepID=A0A0S8G5I2_UNCT6|nr:MAG: hypothetical protein AMJ39_05765 [candidate division TA06 bacterium DG_24]KPK68197.1 MAG: hypothetical protein AMJ82_08850 [candidate division TA06 bacterium SM23_40]
MDWKVIATTFAAIFLAELGDKTQLAILSLAATQRSRLAVFIGAGLALVGTTLLAVLLGTTLARVVPLEYIRIGAGVLLMLLGVLFIVGGL